MSIATLKIKLPSISGVMLLIREHLAITHRQTHTQTHTTRLIESPQLTDLTTIFQSVLLSSHYDAAIRGIPVHCYDYAVKIGAK